MSKENLPANKSNNDSKTNDFKKRVYINLTEISFCTGVGKIKEDYYSSSKNDYYSFGFRTVNGYQFNEHLSLGIGIGVDRYNNDATLLPITFDARATIKKGRVSPVFTANAGYAIGLGSTIGQRSAKGGLVFNPQFGLKTYIHKNVACLFNIGYKWQTMEFSDVYGLYYYSNKDDIYKYITISTGFTF